MKIFSKLNDYDYLINLKKKYTWQQFRECAKITPGTYAESFSRRLYSSIFENTIDLAKEYQKYYRDEYFNIESFLFWRYGISEELLKVMPKKNYGYLTIATFEYPIDGLEILRDSIKSLLLAIERDI